MYVVTFEFSYGGRVNGGGKNYKLGYDVLFKCTCECYKHRTNFANYRNVLCCPPFLDLLRYSNCDCFPLQYL